MIVYLFPSRQRRNTSKHKLISDDANDFVESKTEAKVYIPELGTYSCFKEVADSSSVLSRGRPCNEMGHSYSWLRGKNPMFTRGQIFIEHNLTKFIPPVEVTQGSVC